MYYICVNSYSSVCKKQQDMNEIRSLEYIIRTKLNGAITKCGQRI